MLAHRTAIPIRARSKYRLPNCNATRIEFWLNCFCGEDTICSAINHSGFQIAPAKPDMRERGSKIVKTNLRIVSWQRGF